MWRFAGAVIKAGVAPRTLESTEKVFIALQAGAEVGLSPMQSLKNICIINKTPCIWGDALVALVRNSGKCVSIEERVEGEGEKMVATCEARRTNGVGVIESCSRRFSYQDAKRAALLGKDTYKSYPQRMLAMRARAWCLRDLFADVLAGLGVAEEMQDFPDRPVITSGDDAPLNSLDAAAELLTDAEYVPAEPVADDFPPMEMSAEELADMEREQREHGRLFDDAPQYQ